MPAPGEVTVLLQKAGTGNRAAADQLYRLVEKDLRAIAGKRKKRFENPLEGSTTVLVDDAFCKHVGSDVTTWQPVDRGKFFSCVATKIHDLLVEAARAKLAQKRGGDRKQLDVAALDPAAPKSAAHEESDFMIDLKNTLPRGSLRSARSHRLPHLLFSGLHVRRDRRHPASFRHRGEAALQKSANVAATRAEGLSA